MIFLNKFRKKQLEMKEKINRLRKLDKEINSKPQKEDIDFQEILKKTPKKETDPYLKMYIRGQKSEENLNQEAKTMELENPLYERFAYRTTNNVFQFFTIFFSNKKQCIKYIPQILITNYDFCRY